MGLLTQKVADNINKEVVRHSRRLCVSAKINPQSPHRANVPRTEAQWFCTDQQAPGSTAGRTTPTSVQVVANWFSQQVSRPTTD